MNTTVTIDHRNKLSREDTLREYLAGDGRPVIVLDALVNWPALSKWSFDFFRTQYGSDIVSVRDCIRRPTVEKEMRLNDYLAYLASPSTHSLARETKVTPLALYGYKPFALHPELRHDYGEMYFVDDWLQFLSEQRRKEYNQGWVLMSPAGAVTRLHFDFLSTHAWLAQVVGHKECVLIAPQDTPFVYDGFVDPLNPDWHQYPLFEKATLWVGSLKPGDVLLIPANWWHYVKTIESSITVSHNIMNSANFGAFTDAAMASVRSVPGRPRRTLYRRISSRLPQMLKSSIKSMFGTRI